MSTTTVARTLLYLSSLFAALAAPSAGLALRNVKVGQAIPPFSVEGLDGTTYDNAAFRGKVLLLIFARPGQEASLTALDAAQRVLRHYGEASPAVLVVSSKPEAKEAFDRLARERGLSYPIAMDPGRRLYGDLGLVVTPTTLLIDGDGVLRFEFAHNPPGYERTLGIHLELMLGRIDRARHDELLAVHRDGAPDPQRTAARLKLARTMMKHGKFQQVLTLLQGNASPEHAVEVARVLGEAHLALGQVEEAARCLAPYAETEPISAPLLLVLARVETRRGNDDQAETLLLAALERTPQQAPVLCELGRLYERQGRCELAVEYYRRAADKLFPPSP